MVNKQFQSSGIETFPLIHLAVRILVALHQKLVRQNKTRSLWILLNSFRRFVPSVLI